MNLSLDKPDREPAAAARVRTKAHRPPSRGARLLRHVSDNKIASGFVVLVLIVLVLPLWNHSRIAHFDHHKTSLVGTVVPYPGSYYGYSEDYSSTSSSDGYETPIMSVPSFPKWVPTVGGWHSPRWWNGQSNGVLTTSPRFSHAHFAGDPYSDNGDTVHCVEYSTPRYVGAVHGMTTSRADVRFRFNTGGTKVRVCVYPTTGVGNSVPKTADLLLWVDRKELPAPTN